MLFKYVVFLKHLHKNGVIFSCPLQYRRHVRLPKINGMIHVLMFFFSALFAAIEHGHLEKVRTILESTDVDVNRLVKNSRISTSSEFIYCGCHKLITYEFTTKFTYIMKYYLFYIMNLSI